MVLTCLTLGLLLQQDPGPLPYRLERDIVTINAKNYGLMPPEYVTGNGIQDVKWISGNLLSVDQISVVNGKPQRFIKLYDAPKKTLTTFLLPRSDADFSFKTLHNKTVLVQFLGDTLEDCSLHLVSEKGSRMLYAGITYSLATDGRIALGLVRRTRPTDTIKILLIKNGTCEEFDSGIQGTQARLSLAKPGLMLSIAPPEAKPVNGRISPNHYLFNPQKSAFEKTESAYSNGDLILPERMPESVAARVLKVEIGNLIMTGDEKSEFPTALIAADTNEGQFSLEGNFVYYRFGEHLFVREIRPISEADMELVREEAERRRLLTQAKQLGTAMQIYLMDHDDVFPGRHEKVTDLLMPILKNSDMFTGFVYTYEGGSGTAIADPANTPIGYVQGKYGRAVIYSDSSSRWERRKP